MDQATSGSTTKSKPERSPNACLECRRLKIKCDKVVPCSNCQRRGATSLCSVDPIVPKSDRSEFNESQWGNWPQGHTTGGSSDDNLQLFGQERLEYGMHISLEDATTLPLPLQSPYYTPLIPRVHTDLSSPGNHYPPYTNTLPPPAPRSPYHSSIRSPSQSSDSSASSQRAGSSSLRQTTERLRKHRTESELRRESTRAQRIESERRRREELRKAWLRLKEVVPVIGTSSQKLLLPERAKNHILDISTENAILKAEVEELRGRVTRLREHVEGTTMMLSQKILSPNGNEAREDPHGARQITAIHRLIEGGVQGGASTNQPSDNEMHDVEVNEDIIENGDGNSSGSGSGSGELKFAQSRTSSSASSNASLHEFMRRTGSASSIRL